MAVDEVQLIVGECPATQFCDFENADICGYQDDVNAKLKWMRQKGAAFIEQTGKCLFLKLNKKIMSMGSNNNM